LDTSEEARAISPREEFFKEFLGHLTIPFLKPVAEGFFENIRQVESLIQMPMVMFAMLEVDNQLGDRFRSLALDYWSRGEGFKNFLDEYGKTLAVNPVKSPDFMERALKRHDDLLATPGIGGTLKAAMQVSYSAGVSGSWTALECLATDLWVASLNEEPMTLAQTAISSLEGQEPGELTSKQISVGLAARHGFDLRSCLGTVLKSRFDFTAVSGIQKAYKVFVPNDEFIEKVLTQRELSELEAARHVIVHRAGRVDEEYRRRARSNLAIGTVLTFNSEDSARFCYLASQAGTGLLAFVNDWLVKKRAQVESHKT